MRKLFFLCLIMLLGTTLFYSCSRRDEVAPEQLGFDYSYFPLERGGMVIYNVREVIYQAGADSVVKVYQEMYRIGDTLNGSNTVDNPQMWRLERYSRATTISDWNLDSVWTVRFSGGKTAMVITENNVPVVRLSFPLKEGLKWNANSQNIYNSSGQSTNNIQPADLSQLKNYQKPYTSDTTVFPNTLTVIQSDKDAFTDKDIRNEVYAKDIGMVYKIMQIYTYRVVNGVTLTGNISFGRSKEWKYYTHGTL